MLLRRFAPRLEIALLALASLFFYEYWNWRFLWVILLSIGVNYVVDLQLGAGSPDGRQKWILTLGITKKV